VGDVGSRRQILGERESGGALEMEQCPTCGDLMLCVSVAAKHGAVDIGGGWKLGLVVHQEKSCTGFVAAGNDVAAQLPSLVEGVVVTLPFILKSLREKSQDRACQIG
jgi:hypothetical protein